MKELFSFLFDIATEPLGLSIPFWYEWAILLVIGEFAYQIAYAAVGKSGMRGNAGSALHWFIRVIVYVIIWAVIYAAIQIYYFIAANWQIILMIAGSVAGVAMLCILAVATMRFIKKHRTVNGNA